MLPMITCNIAVLAIAIIYLEWRDRRGTAVQRREVLRDRVAYMLWVVAHQK